MSNRFNKLRVPLVVSAATVVGLGAFAYSNFDKGGTPRSSHSAPAPECIKEGSVTLFGGEVGRLTGQNGPATERAAWSQVGKIVAIAIERNHYPQPDGEFIVSAETHQFPGESSQMAIKLAAELDNLAGNHLEMSVGDFESFVDPAQQTTGNWAAMLWFTKCVDYDYQGAA